MDTVIVRPFVKQQFDRFMQDGRILFISAPCGFGKTTVADALLTGQTVIRLNATDAGLTAPFPETGNLMLVDDLQLMQEDDWPLVRDWIRHGQERRLMLLSRGAVPGILMEYTYNGQMIVLEADDLLFDHNDIRKLYDAYEITVTDSEINGILKESLGYPLGVVITARYMSGGRAFGTDVVERAFIEVYRYFETAVYHRLDLPVRRFLLELAPFENFDIELARMVSGDQHAGALLSWLLKNTTMLRYDGTQRYYFWSKFRGFLLWEMEREYTDEKCRMLYSRGGLYYELKEDYVHALECYTRGGDHSKVSELLIRNAQLHPGMGHYSEMERYYRSLPESEILASPSLMQGMSMLCALAMDYAGSERWYRELREFGRRCDRQDAAGKQARSRLAWLDISLPQRGVESLIDTIPAVFRLMTNKEVNLPAFSVTSALPSIMNGGKDFSAWSKKDDLLYQTIRIPVEAVLGKDSVGLADCAIAESKFEKGENISNRMLSLIPIMSEVRQNGTPDIEYAINGLFVRNQLANGQPEDARRTIHALREQYEQRGLTRFLPNMDAMCCRIELHMDQFDRTDEWYRTKAPRDPMHLNVMKRYQYLTQAMVELADGRVDAAMITLAPLEPYCQKCGRYIDAIHLHVLTAVALYRKKEDTWREHLTEALTTAQEYRFIRTISVYGDAVLPLLEDLHWDKNKRWFDRLMTDTRAQAALYPHFLESHLAQTEVLTPTETQILHLICADKSNAQIAQIMNIKLTTVKTHVSHILSKLDVSRRSEAKTVAKKLRLVP